MDQGDSVKATVEKERDIILILVFNSIESSLANVLWGRSNFPSVDTVEIICPQRAV